MKLQNEKGNKNMMKKMEAGKTSKRRTENDYYGTYDTDKTPLSTYIPAAFEAIRKQFGLEAKNMRTPNEAKLKKQQERFMQKHQCPVCGGTKTFIKGTNVMVCQNPECKGVPVKDKDGNVVSYNVPFSELSNKSEAIASAILD